MRLYLTGLLIAVLSHATPAQTTWHVDLTGFPPGDGSTLSPYTSIQYAIDQPTTVDGDKLLIHPGTYQELVDLAGKALILESLSGPATTVIDGQLQGTVITVNVPVGSVELRGLSITGGTGTAGDGGGVHATGSTLLLDDCLVIENGYYPESARGAGVYAANSFVRLLGTEISDNLSNTFGAGLCAIACTVVVEESDFILNETEGDGAGVHLDSCSLTCTDTDFIANSSWGAGKGGGVHLIGGSASLYQCGFEDNGYDQYTGGTGRGAAFHAEQGADVYFDSCLLKGNSASLQGGALCFDASTVEISRSFFLGNRVAGSGSAIYGSNSSLAMDETVIAQNGLLVTFAQGCGVVLVACSTTVEDSQFVMNYGGAECYDGGGLYSAGGSLELSRCTFDGNSAARGAGLFCGSLTTVQDCEFVGNVGIECGNISPIAHYGTAIASTATSPIYVERTLIAGNDGRHILDGNIELENCTIVDNTGWDALASGTTMNNCIVWNNDPAAILGTATYSAIEGGLTGVGNIASNPLFCDGANGDYKLNQISPCVDTGDPTSPLDPDGTVADMGVWPLDPTDCPGCPPIQTYCTAKVASIGCVPTIASSGEATLSGPDDLMFSAANVYSNKFGILFWGASPTAVPFLGGTLCVQPPLIRTIPASSGGGGADDCSGSLSFHFTQALMVSKFLTPGDSICAQFYFRDPGFPAPSNVGLSDAAQAWVCP